MKRELRVCKSVALADIFDLSWLSPSQVDAEKIVGGTNRSSRGQEAAGQGRGWWRQQAEAIALIKPSRRGVARLMTAPPSQAPAAPAVLPAPGTAGPSSPHSSLAPQPALSG